MDVFFIIEASRDSGVPRILSMVKLATMKSRNET